MPLTFEPNTDVGRTSSFAANAIPAAETTYRRATALALVLAALLTLASLLVPPSLSHDAGWGMQQWRTMTGGGAFNTNATPDPADISRDQATFVTWWSPGQYLVPGVLTLTSLRLGTALTITSGLSLLLCLLGWIQVAKHFGLSERVAILAVVFMATFRYSTLPFGIYNGGEILLQGLTPWIILAACRVPFMSAGPAALVACLMVWAAFFAKLTGVLVVAAALLIAALEALSRVRRITNGMIAGAVGAVIGLGILFPLWFTRGTTPATGKGFTFSLSDLYFALTTPWGAGISWGDMLAAFMRRSAGADQSTENHLPVKFLLLLLPPVVLFVAILAKGWRIAQNENLHRLIKITIGFYLVCAVVMSGIFMHGGDVSLEERHLRAAGMLIFVCILAILDRLPARSAWNFAVIGLCLVMSLYGCFAFAKRARTVQHQELDPYSRTYLINVDESAIGFAKDAFAREGRNDLFVLPSPDSASAFSSDARVLTNHVEAESDAAIVERTYHGKVPGRLFVMMPADVAESDKGQLLLKEFVDYPVEGWEKRSFGETTMFVQPAASGVQ